MNRVVLVRLIAIVFFIAYPFIVFFGLRKYPPGFLGLLLLAVLAMRFGVLVRKERQILLPMLVIFLSYSILTMVLNSAQMLLYYPALVNLGLFITFAGSLRHGEPLLLRLVSARGARISEHTPEYLHKLTAVWAGFFVLNGIVSVWTGTLSMEAWTLYNGMLSYCIVALLIGAELLFRHFYIKRKSVGSR